MNYQPNFADPRVRSRVLTALGWALGCLSTTKPHAWSTRFIDQWLGYQSRPLGSWLRQQLLITTRDTWSIHQHQCKEYLLRESGVRYLREQLGLDKGSLTRPNTSSAAADSCLISQADLELTTNTHSIPYCSGSLDKTRSWDYFVVNRWVEREFGQQLRELEFEYSDKNHRLWHGLQNVRSHYRSLILEQNGLPYQYDIDCSAPTLIYQYAQQQGMDVWPAAIVRYLDDKHAIRQHLADQIESPVETIKVLINALFCGARLGRNDSFAISHLLDHDPARIICLQQDPYIQQLRTDIRDCWRYIEPTLPVTYIHTRSGPRRRPTSSRAKWNVYFGMERQVLNAVREYLRETHNRHFLEHDGWTSEQPVDQDQLIAKVYQQTGFRIRLTVNKEK